jgi:hypothetical protein
VNITSESSENKTILGRELKSQPSGSSPRTRNGVATLTLTAFPNTIIKSRNCFGCEVLRISKLRSPENWLLSISNRDTVNMELVNKLIQENIFKPRILIPTSSIVENIRYIYPSYRLVKIKIRVTDQPRKAIKVLSWNRNFEFSKMKRKAQFRAKPVYVQEFVVIPAIKKNPCGIIVKDIAKSAPVKTFLLAIVRSAIKIMQKIRALIIRIKTIDVPAFSETNKFMNL